MNPQVIYVATAPSPWLRHWHVLLHRISFRPGSGRMDSKSTFAMPRHETSRPLPPSHVSSGEARSRTTERHIRYRFPATSNPVAWPSDASDYLATPGTGTYWPSPYLIP